MVEWYNHSIEKIICKTILGESDWCPMLPSVLFALRTSVHSSTGFTPFHLLYNFDPVLPFEYDDKLKNGMLNDDDSESECDDKSDHCETSGTTNCDPILSKIQYMEDQHKDIFDKASDSIKLRSIKLKGITTGKPRANHSNLAIKASSKIVKMIHAKQ